MKHNFTGRAGRGGTPKQKTLQRLTGIASAYDPQPVPHRLATTCGEGRLQDSRSQCSIPPLLLRATVTSSPCPIPSSDSVGLQPALTWHAIPLYSACRCLCGPGSLRMLALLPLFRSLCVLRTEGVCAGALSCVCFCCGLACFGYPWDALLPSYHGPTAVWSDIFVPCLALPQCFSIYSQD